MITIDETTIAKIMAMAEAAKIQKEEARAEWQIAFDKCEGIDIFKLAASPEFKDRQAKEIKYLTYRRIQQDLEYVLETIKHANQLMKEVS